MVVLISIWGRGRPVRHIPCQAIFSHHMPKMQPRSPVLPHHPQPCWGAHPAPGPRNFALLDSFLYGNISPVASAEPCHCFFLLLLLLAILKTRNKRIFNEPPQRACVCFVWCPGMEDSLKAPVLHFSALPSSSGVERKGAEESWAQPHRATTAPLASQLG